MEKFRISQRNLNSIIDYNRKRCVGKWINKMGGMNMENIKFNTKSIAKYYMENRQHWDEFYLSEKRIMSSAMNRFETAFSVLDVGCACGGLAGALYEKYKISSYCGVDINEEAIAVANKQKKSLPFPQEFRCEDIVKTKDKKEYDIVICLGAADCNVDYNGIVNSCWNKVKEEGSLILSGRFTNGESLYDKEVSYQLMEDYDNGEKASYVVMNFLEWVDKICMLKDLYEVEGYGYYGKPAVTVRTLYNEVCFGTMALRKIQGGGIIRMKLDVPMNLFLSKSYFTHKNKKV